MTFLLRCVLLSFLSLVWLQPTLAGVADPFQTPPGLAPAVEFWKRVYTEVDTGGGFIHDDRHLDVVYETLRFPRGTSKRGQGQRIREAVDRYRRVLLKLANAKPAAPDALEKRVLAQWSKDPSPRTLRAAAYRLRFQRGQADKFREGLIRAGAWEGYILSILRDMGLPRELVALPHVESSYNPAAWSKVGAAGMWQFTRSTGRRYLRIDHVVDERMDPYKATKAAARLLQHNYDVTGAWPLAITAYNHGVAGMRRASQSLGTKDISTIVKRYNGRVFGFASRNFYAAFLAALEVSGNAERYFGRLKRHSPPRHAVLKTPEYLSVASLEKGLGISRNELRRLNPSLQPSVWNGNKYVPRGYRLRLPEDADGKALKASLLRVASTEGFDAQKPDRYYRVASGDTLSGIARRYKTGLDEIAALNGLTSYHRIRAGQVLRLPVPGEAAPTVASSGSRETEGTVYRVRSGDTLWEIAHQFGVDEGRLAKVNGLSDRRRIYPGQVLRVAMADTTLSDTASDVPLVVEAVPSATSDPPAVKLAMTETPLAPVTEEKPSPAREAQEEVLATPQPDLSADPADYAVAEDGSIEIQAAETLGHYAEWLKVRASDLRRLNHMRYGQPVVVGRRLKLDFSRLDPERFEVERLTYHRTLQAAYFGNHRIEDTCRHELKRGESLWVLAKQTYDLPLWLLRQYNPDLEFNNVLPPGTMVVIPRIEKDAADVLQAADPGSGAQTCRQDAPALVGVRTGQAEGSSVGGS